MTKHIGEVARIAAPLGMSAHPVIRGSAYYLALKLCYKVAHNPNLDLLILPFACTRINKKLCLKMCFLRKRILCASCTYIMSSSRVCVYHLFVHNNVGTIEYRSINKNKNKLSDWLTGTECVNHSINITFAEPG